MLRNIVSQLHIAAMVTLLFTMLLSTAAHSEELTRTLPRFGTLHIYRPAAVPKHVALFISGEGGWDHRVEGMARTLTDLETLVVGININHYLEELERSDSRCNYAAADFEALSQQVQQTLGLIDYKVPVLVGYSSGATLAYAIAVEAPSGTFRGALSLGFTHNLPLNKTLCTGNGLRFERGLGGGINLLPAPHLQIPWIVLQGDLDQVAYTQKTQAFAARIPHARVVVLPHVGHGFSAESQWLPQFRHAFLQLALDGADPAAHNESDLQDLPLVEVPAQAAAQPCDCLALLVTGDGGWAGLVQGISGALAQAGVPVVGLNALKYYWTRHDATATAHDVERIADHYLNAWKKQRLILIGYSFGADVLPFAVEKLPADLQQRVDLLALIGPDHTAAFEFHVVYWVGASFGHESEAILPVMERLHGVPPTICIYGTEEKHSLCRALDPVMVKRVELKGAHHFDGDYDALAQQILAELKR